MFDVKLIDGRYFKNVIIVDEFCRLDKHEDIVNHDDYSMFLFYTNDEDCENELAEVKSDGIEYVCKSYTYKEGNQYGYGCRN